MLTPLTFSHGNEDGHDEEPSNKSPINPLKYIEDKQYTSAIFIIIFWILILKGLYELTLMVLSKHIK